MAPAAGDTAQVTVHDDLPAIEIVSGAEVGEPGTSWATPATNDDAVTATTEGQELGGTIDFFGGADGVGSVAVQIGTGTPVTILKAQADGSLVLENASTVTAEGNTIAFTYSGGNLTYKYTAENTTGSGDVVTLLVTDADGDIAKDTIIFTLNTPTTANGATVTLYENAVDAQADNNTYTIRPGSNAAATSNAKVDGSLNISSETSYSFEWDDTDFPANIQARIGDAWQTVSWAKTGDTITGKVGDVTVVSIEASQQGALGIDTYSAKVSAALRHDDPDTAAPSSDTNKDLENGDDSLTFTFTLTGGDGPVTGALKVQIVDDAPQCPTGTGAVSISPVDGTPLSPDISLDFNGYGVNFNDWTTPWSDRPRENIIDVDGVLTVVDAAGNPTGITVVATGMLGNQLGAGDLTYNGKDGDKGGNPGLGMFSPKDESQGFWWDGSNSEIGQGSDTLHGESFQFFLPKGQVAYGLGLDLAHFYSNELEIERCEIVFYKGDTIVHSIVVTADSDLGMASSDTYLSGAYDSVLIRPIDLKANYVGNENSDFNIEAIRFLGASAGTEIIASASGKIQANFGADGPANTPYDFLGVTGGIVSGENIIWTVDPLNALRMVGKHPGTDETVAEVIFQILNLGSKADTPTLTWSLYQYKGFDVGAGQISINYAAVDSDGDGAPNQVLVDALAGANIIFGSALADIPLSGTDGDDVLVGKAGDDFLVGGKGNDILFGGSGEDIFAWTQESMDQGKDIIKDFSIKDGDKILIEGLFPASGDSVDTILAQKIDAGELSLTSNVDNTSLEIEIDHNRDGIVDQTIVVDLTSPWTSQTEFASIDPATDEGQAALLKIIMETTAM